MTNRVGKKANIRESGLLFSFKVGLGFCLELDVRLLNAED